MGSESFDFYCAMVLDTSGKKFDMDVLIQDSNVTSVGAQMSDLATVLKNQGLSSARYKVSVSVNDLLTATSKGNPAIVRMDLERGYHAVVVDGITKRQGVDVVAIRDPARGKEYFTPLNEFRDKYTGHTILTNP